MSQTTINFRFRVGGVLTDVTSAVLRDATAAYGVRRTDTNAVVVAAGTAMVHDGTGLYSYTFTDPAAGLSYQSWIEVVYGGATYRFEKLSTAAGEADDGSYCTLAEADAIAAALPGLASFKASTADARTAALLLATVDFDAAYRWQGRKYDLLQTLEFPRLAYGELGAASRQYAAASTLSADVVWDWDDDANAAIVPTDVKRAVVFQADSIISGDRDGRLQAITDGLASQAVGSMSESYRPDMPPKRLCARADALAQKYVLRSGQML